MRALPSSTILRRMVVFLPDEPVWLLATLRQTAFLLEQAATPLPVLILSRCPTSWLWQTLLHLVDDRRLLSEVHCAASNLPGRCIAALLRGNALQAYPLLAQLSEQETLIHGKAAGGLSKSELHAILDLLHGYSIIDRAKHHGVSQKTLYNQRTSGLKKMANHHPQLAAHFPGNPLTEQDRTGSETLSAFEREFVHAIHCRQIFPVFQPIIDDRQQLQGVEILSRWRTEGNILPPGAFLPQVHSAYAWLVLTAFLLQEAVQKIDQYPGAFYFSINVPPVIAGHENLIRMMETARQQLRPPRRADRLVLEFAETVDLNQNGKIGEIITALQQRGFRIMLDDCFSQSSVMFPARQVRFSEYKLDMSIVSDMQRDPYALALIKSLIYYCQLTGSRCVAEGVDSQEKYTMLKALGIDRFQGYLISPPVECPKLDELILHRYPVATKDKASA